MKHLKLIILFFIIINPNTAQTYISFFEEADKWNFLLDGGFFSGSTLIASIKTDTIINEHEYFKLEFSYEQDFFYEVYCSPECYGYHHMDLFIREDSLHEKLFFLSGLTNREYLICDLTLTLNDTLIIHNQDMEKLVLVPSNIYFEDNRKVIEFQNSNDYQPFGEINLKFIEGIGSNWGFFTGFSEYYNLLLCIYHDDSITYKISEDAQCDYWWVGDECLIWPCYQNYKSEIESKMLKINVIRNDNLISFEFINYENE